MTDLEQACTDLPPWLPELAQLIAEPDHGGTAPTRSKPRSRPPWNTPVANAITDIHAEARHSEAALRYVVTGTVTIRGGSDGNTLKAIQAVISLSHAVDQALAADTAAIFGRLLNAILRLPAIDLEQPPRILPCPRCSRKMLRYWENSDEVACYGCMQKATISIGYVSGEPMLTWQDGWLAS